MSLESNNLIIEKYTPNAKYPMDYFYPGPPLDQSGSNSSTSQYRVSLLIIVIPDEKISNEALNALLPQPALEIRKVRLETL